VHCLTHKQGLLRAIACERACVRACVYTFYTPYYRGYRAPLLVWLALL